MAIKILENEAHNFSAFLHREILLQVTVQFKVRLNTQLVLIQDDNKNFKVDAELSEWITVIYNNKKITGYDNINKFIKDYDTLNNSDINQQLNKYINSLYGKYSNADITNLAKEYNINL